MAEPNQYIDYSKFLAGCIIAFQTSIKEPYYKPYRFLEGENELIEDFVIFTKNIEEKLEKILIAGI